MCRLTGTSIMLFSAQFQFNVVVASSSQATTLPRASILVQSTKRCMILPRPMGNENVTYPAGTCTFFCLLMDSSFGRRKKIFYCQQEEILGMRIVGMLCLPTRQVHYIIPQSPSRGICPSLPPVINPGSTTRLARSPHNCAC